MPRKRAWKRMTPEERQLKIAETERGFYGKIISPEAKAAYDAHAARRQAAKAASPVESVPPRRRYPQRQERQPMLPLTCALLTPASRHMSARRRESRLRAIRSSGRNMWLRCGRSKQNVTLPDSGRTRTGESAFPHAVHLFLGLSAPARRRHRVRFRQ